MIIDKHGIIEIENLGITITPEFSLEDLKNFLPNEHIKYVGSNSGYDRYVIQDMIFDGLPFSGLFIFYLSRISFIDLGYVKFKDKPPWETEADDKKLHDELMKKQHGATKVKYDWGTIESCIDNKVGGASIIIKYHNFPIKHRDAH